MTEMPAVVGCMESFAGRALYSDRYIAINAQNTDVYPLLDKVDHVICDPPYGEFTHTGNNRRRDENGKVAVVNIPFAKLSEDDQAAFCDLSATKVEGWSLTFCDARGVYVWSAALMDAGCKVKGSAVWIKPDAMPQFNGKCPAMGHESIVYAWCGQGHSRWNGGGRTGVFTHVKRHTGSHPTEKPLPLMRELVTLFTNPGDIVFDPFMGSGSTGVACLELGRRFIGVERDPTYYATACKRLAAAAQVVPLFGTTGKPKPVTLFEGEKTYATRTAAKKKG